MSSNNDAIKKARKNIFDKTLANGKKLKKVDPTTFGALNKASSSFFADLEKEKPKVPVKPKPKTPAKTATATVKTTITLTITVTGPEKAIAAAKAKAAKLM